ncbi:tail protein X [Rhizobium sp. S163]|uniref:tail protein X n=1 Tax=Rhizobium sp. S163 TaxID=3055039 RepID=UPI0025A9D4E5|nr:tail protein X [Rhizobium sp. S163]MDM9647766.1 tail protein X [Rhizobium sp. S163]
MTTYTVAFGGERLDRIAKKTLQTELSGAVEALLSANPDLGDAAASGFVPGGTIIVIPSAFSIAPKAARTLAWE